MRPAAVLFDCDGVIVDSEPITTAIIADSLGDHGLDLGLLETNRLFVGGTMEGAAERAKALGAALPDDWVDQIYAAIFDRLATHTPLITGIERVFDALDRHDVPYAVGSNGPHRKMAITLGQHPALYRRLNGRILSREDVANPKPAPDLYLRAARLLGVDPTLCVVIEDSASGVRAAVAAGMRCLAYAPHGGYERLGALGAIPFEAMCNLPALLGLPST